MLDDLQGRYKKYGRVGCLDTLVDKIEELLTNPLRTFYSLSTKVDPQCFGQPYLRFLSVANLLRSTPDFFLKTLKNRRPVFPPLSLVHLQLKFPKLRGLAQECPALCNPFQMKLDYRPPLLFPIRNLRRSLIPLLIKKNVFVRMQKYRKYSK